MRVDHERHVITFRQSLDEPFWLGWFAAIMDGEGSFLVRVDKKTSGNYSYACLSLGSSDYETVETLKALVPESTIIKQKHLYGGTKPMWKWRVQQTGLAIDLALRIRPFMCPRRQEQIDTMVSQVGDWDQRKVGTHISRVEKARVMGLNRQASLRAAQ